jgi:hypothetical protein
MTPLSALSAHEDVWSRLLARDDVQLHDGILHLVHDSVTPEEARTSDLLLVADALEAAGVHTALIRHDGGIPAIVIDLAERDAALSALRDLGDQHPLYLKMRGCPAILAADATAVGSEPAAVRVYRPRITRTSGLRYGSPYAVRVEFWRFDSAEVTAPRANVLTRRVTPAQDISPATVERYGRTWRTFTGMFDPQPDEFTEDIDIVFSWVDGSSTEFQRRRAAQQEKYVVGDGDDSPARYRHVDELRYALRSVHMYAPWIRRIFIATDSPAPHWLREHPRVTIVRSEDFFADPTVLPTHNSHAVESQLHRIPGLAEHFLYSNDDMFFGRLLDPGLFFTSAGISRFVESDVKIGAGEPTLRRSGHDNALRVNRALLHERFGRTIVRDLEHCATPLRRSVMAELEREFAEDFARTAAARFRSASDVSVTNSLYHYYALLTGRAVTTRRPHVRYVQTTTADGLHRMARLSTRRDLDMFCLNDGGESEVAETIRITAVRAALEQLFPVRAPWERVEVSAGSSEVQSELPSAQR